MIAAEAAAAAEVSRRLTMAGKGFQLTRNRLTTVLKVDSAYMNGDIELSVSSFVQSRH